MRLLLCLLALPLAARAWEPVPGHIMSPWAAKVTADKPLPEYPRPQLTRPRWLNLNGLWDYAIVGADTRPTTWDGQILVPFPIQSALSGVKKPVQPDQRLWYHTSFRVPPAWRGDRLLLHFGAVDWETTVWLNGAELGSHRGGYTPFTFDLTDHLAPGDNELIVRVFDPTNAGWQPRGKQVLRPGGIMYTAVTGIWQTVWLEPVPASHIARLTIVPDLDAATVTVTTHVPGDATGLTVRLLGQDGRTWAEGRPNEPVTAKVAPVRAWTPADPRLYDLQVALARGGREIDRVDSYFALRKISLGKDAAGITRLLLNNRFVFQHGPLDQGWWPDGLYTAPTDEALRFDIEATLKLGYNMARKHVKIEPARWYYWCDKLGLLVWQDMVSGDADKTDEAKANYRAELRAMIETLHNHPSLVVWIPFNEGWGQHDTPEVVARVKSLDLTRLVTPASGWHDAPCGDIRDIHAYPGPAAPPVEEKRAIVLGEYGGLGLPLEGHLWVTERNWGYRNYTTQPELTAAYLDLNRRLHRLIGQGLSAAVYTQTTDCEIEVNGLLTYDRKVFKVDVEQVAASNRALHLPAPATRPLVADSRVEPQTWRYTVTRPAEGWAAPGFDDTAWATGPGGFGTAGTPGAVVRTVWNGTDIWLRRTLTLDRLPADIELLVHHDEDAEIWLNGVLAAKTSGYTTDYEPLSLAPAARATLKLGENLLAVHCQQTRGGQYIDVGLVEVIPAR